jgi:hypothetical protein
MFHRDCSCIHTFISMRIHTYDANFYDMLLIKYAIFLYWTKTITKIDFPSSIKVTVSGPIQVPSLH